MKRPRNIATTTRLETNLRHVGIATCLTLSCLVIAITLLGTRFHASAQTDKFPVGPGPLGLAFDGSSIRAGSVDNTVTKLRASDGANLGTFSSVGSMPFGVTFDGANIWASIWVANNSNSSVTRIFDALAPTPTPTPAQVDVSGTWTGRATSTTGSGGVLTVALTQNAAQVAGSFGFKGDNGTTASGNLSGSVSGNTFTFSSAHFFDSGGCGSQLTNGSAQVTGATMQGTTSIVHDVSQQCGNVSGTTETAQFTLTNQQTPTPTPTPTCGSWTTKALMPSPVIEAAGLVWGGKFYVLDGATFGGGSYPSEVYDPVADSWSYKTPDPVRRTESAGGVINDKVYLAEGWLNSDSSSPTTALEIYDPATDSWTSGASSLIARGASARAVIGTKLYVAGGSKFGNGVKFSDLEIYDSTTNSWSTGASMPKAIEQPVGAAINGKFYVVGGDYGPTTTNNTISNLLFIYDPATNSWSSGTSMPTPRTGPAAGVSNGKLYVVGGSGSSGVLNTVEIYDPASDSWTTGPPEPVAQYLHVAGVINSNLYVTGGYNASGSVDGNLAVLNTQGTWTTKAPMLKPLAGSVAGVISARLYVMGGNACANPAGCGFPPGTAFEVYNPATDTWATTASDPTPRSGAGAGVINNKLYVVGGCINTDCASTTNMLEVFDPASNTWTSLAPMPTARSEVFAGAINGKLYVAGGTVRFTNALTALEVYDPSTNTWDTTKAPLPVGQAQGTAAVVNGNLYVIGGFDPRATTGGPFSVGTVQAYDPVSDTWSTKATMPTARQSSAAGVVNGLLYVVGGSSASGILSTNEAYDPLTNTWATQAAMPTARFGLAAGVINGVLYAVGSATLSGISLGTNEAFTASCAGSNNKPPVALCHNVTVSAGPNCTANASIDNGSFDPDPGDTITLSQSPAGPYPLGTTTVTLTATDNHGASSSCTATVTVVDTTPPSITAPPPITAYTGSGATSCGIVISNLGVANATDNCSTVSISLTGVPAGNFFPVGTTTITYTAHDAAGNTATATQLVTVIDNTPPVISCPANITMIAALGSSNALVTYPAPTATDNCGVTAISSSAPSGSNFPLGTTTVSLTATDASNNTASCAFIVTVLTPQGATQQLSNRVSSLVSQGVLNQGNGNALTSKLQAAIRSLNNGHTTAGCNQLQAFVNQTQAFINSGKLTAAQGQALIASAKKVKSVLGC